MKNVNKRNDRRRRKTVQTRNVSAAKKGDEDEEQKRHHAAQIGDRQLSDVGEKSHVRLGIDVDVHLKIKQLKILFFIIYKLTKVYC